MLYGVSLLALTFLVHPDMNNSQVLPIHEEAHESHATEALKIESKEKFKEKQRMITINPLRGQETVKIGQRLLYTASVHGSVGYTASAISSSSDDLPLVESFIEYDNEENAKLSGGDAATKYFIFEAKQAGTYEIHASHYFRGELENEFVITIIVE